MTPLDKALNYIGRDWSVVPIPHRTKRPVIEGWQKLRITASDAPRYFNSAPLNIGVLLGEPSSHLTDLDMDWRETVQLAPYFCPKTLVFGRASNASSHALVRCVGAVTKKFSLPEENGGMVLELRSTGCQTVMPGSTHPSGEAIEFENDAEIVEIARDKLEARCARWASAAVLLRFWTKGHRDELAATLAALLLRAGWTPEHVDQYIKLIATAAGDDNVRDRLKAHAIENAITKNAKTFGHKKLKEILGATVAEKLAEWLGMARRHDESPSSAITYRCVANIDAEHITWLWLNKIARGKMTAVAGDPGLGKSQATVSMAAVVSTGGRWPVDRSQCAPGSVVILSAEDGAADTIRPRLEAAGADLTRCYVIDAVREVTGSGSTQERGFSLDRDAARLGDMLAEIGDVALVIVDPISAYLGPIDSHNNAEVRGVLTPLAKVADDHGAALVMVSHLTKGQNAKALMKIMGSLAFVAAARAAYVVCRDPDDECGARRLFLPVKNNLAPDTEGLAFKVEGVTLPNGIVTSRIMWESDAVTTTADEALAPREVGDRAPKQREAEDWLRQQLAGGAVLQVKIEELARAAGLSIGTLRIARKRLNVRSTKAKGAGGAWSWALPDGGDNDPAF